MRPAVIVPVDPVPNDPPRLLERLKLVLPDTLFFETPKEPFDDPVLLRRVRGDELLRQPIVSAGLAESPTLKDQPIVAAHGRRQAYRPQRPKACQARGFDGALSFLRPSAPCNLIANQFTIVAINHRGQMRPAVPTTGNVRHIHGPAFVTPTGAADPAAGPRARGARALMHQPALQLEHAIDGCAIHHEPLLAAQQRPELTIPKGRMLLNQFPQAVYPRRIPHRPRARRRTAMQSRTGDAQDPTAPTLRNIRQGGPHPSEVFRSKGYGFKASRKISLSSTSSPIVCLSSLICSSRSAS